MTRSKTLGALAVAGLLGSVASQAAIVSGTFAINTAHLPTLYSGTLDAPCATPGGSFFTCVPDPTPVAIAITTGVGGSTGGGTITVIYDNATGEVSEVTNLNFWVSDMSITITSFVTGVVGVTGGNGFPVSGFGDLPRLQSGTQGSNGTADVDSNASPTIFQHDAPGVQVDATDFARFVDIVDTCVGSACALIPVLNIDALRYEIVGAVTIGATNTWSGNLRAETSNNSNYHVLFTSTEVPVPAAVWLFGSGLGLLGFARRRAS